MINLFYCTDANFGDAMSPLIVEKLSGQKTRPSSMWKADMMAVGSVFYHGGYLIGDWAGDNKFRYIKTITHICHSRITRPIDVWGSGFLRYPHIKRPYIKRRVNFHALRGEITKNILRDIGVLSDSAVVLGDPGVLFARLWGITSSPRYDIGIVPHTKDRVLGEQICSKYTSLGLMVKFIDVSKRPEEVVKDISLCHRIMSSSLHGLIVADSLAIKNLHMELSTLGYPQEDFELKFRDYYSAFGMPTPRSIPGNEILSNPNEFLDNKYFNVVALEKIREIQEALLKAFPYKI